MSNDKLKESHSKLAITLWVIYGIYFLLSKQMGSLLITILYFSIGIFLASLASIPTYILRNITIKLMNRIKILGASSLVGILFFIINILWLWFIAVTFLMFTEGIFIQQKADNTVINSVIQNTTEDSKTAFKNSIIALNQVRALQPNGIGSMSKSDEEKMYQLTEKAIELSKKVNDDFLNNIHPQLKNMYRDKLIKGAEIWYDGVKANDVPKQIQGSQLDKEWLDWFDINKEKIGNVIF